MKLIQVFEGKFADNQKEMKVFNDCIESLKEYAFPLLLGDKDDLTGNSHLKDEIAYLKRSAPTIFEILNKAFNKAK